MEIIREFGISNNENEAKKGLSTAIRRMRANYDHNELGVVFFSSPKTEYVYSMSTKELDDVTSEDQSMGGLFSLLVDKKGNKNKRFKYKYNILKEALDY